MRALLLAALLLAPFAVILVRDWDEFQEARQAKPNPPASSPTAAPPTPTAPLPETPRPPELPAAEIAVLDQLGTGPNKYNIKAKQIRSMLNPKGEGVIVYVPGVRVADTERKVAWMVLRGKVYPLNGATRNLTPNLPFPRDVDEQVWRSTGLSPYSAIMELPIPW